MKKFIPCPGCAHRDLYFIIIITEDYVTLECPNCEVQFAITAGADEDR